MSKNYGYKLLVLSLSFLLMSCSIKNDVSNNVSSSENFSTTSNNEIEDNTTSENVTSNVNNNTLSNNDVSSNTSDNTNSTSELISNNQSENNPSIDSTSSNISNPDDGPFKITTTVTDGYTISNNIYKITKAGSYYLSGELENGQIYVEALDSEKVYLYLDNVTISCDFDSPIYFKSADKGYVNATPDSQNEIIDARGKDYVASDTSGSAAIYAECDLNIQGTGSLSVTGNYNNGIHTKDDLSIKDISLSVKAYDNAIKGNDSLEIKSGDITAISTGGDTLKTSNSDISSKGNQRGTISISGGNINLYACQDAIDASYDVNITGGTLKCYTGSNSKYSSEVASSQDKETTNLVYLRLSSNLYNQRYRYAMYLYNDDNDSTWVDATYLKSATSGRNTYYYYTLNLPKNYQNFKLYAFDSSMTTNSTSTYKASTSGATINTSRDMFAVSTTTITNASLSGSWSSYTTTTQPGFGGQDPNKVSFDYSCKGIKSDNLISITSGDIEIKSDDDGIHANSDVILENNAEALGNITITGGNISITTKDDGIHADRKLLIEGNAEIHVLDGYEGLEANQIEINGGKTYVSTKDDGVNASTSTFNNASILVTGGYLDVTVPTGDTDGIDSNGTYTQTGGFVITRCGATGGGAGALDTDGAISITGGTLVNAGAIEKNPTANGNNAVILWGSTSGFGGSKPGGSTGGTTTFSFPSGEYKVEGTNITFTLSATYTKLWISSDELKVGQSYTLSGPITKSWSQSSSLVNGQ